MRASHRELRAKTANVEVSKLANESLTVVLNFGEFGVAPPRFAQLQSKSS